LAQTIKLLADDSKPGSSCLLNLDRRFDLAGFRLREIALRHPAFQNWRAARGAYCAEMLA